MHAAGMMIAEVVPYNLCTIIARVGRPNSFKELNQFQCQPVFSLCALSNRFRQIYQAGLQQFIQGDLKLFFFFFEEEDESDLELCSLTEMYVRLAKAHVRGPCIRHSAASDQTRPDHPCNLQNKIHILCGCSY